MAMKPRKVAVIGAGRAGSQAAFSLACLGVCEEIVLIDTDYPKALAQAMDLADAAVQLPYPVGARAGELSDCTDADLAVVCAAPCQYREDPARMIKAMDRIAGPLAASGFHGLLVNISNPCDVVTRRLRERTGFAPNLVIGTSTALDSARLRRELSLLLKVDPRSIHACAMGEHGESQTVPWSRVTVGGRSLFSLRNEFPGTYGRIDLAEVANRVRHGGRRVLEGKGSAEFGVGSALATIARAYLCNERRVLPVSAWLEGEYGQSGVYAGVPAVLGGNGVERIIEIDLAPEEKTEFAASCTALRAFYDRVR